MSTKIKEIEMKRRQEKEKIREGISKCRLLITLVLFFSLSTLSAQRISNVQASFDEEKMEVTVSCYLESTKPHDLSLSYSDDKGKTWRPCETVSGDIKDQTTGEKKIVWEQVLDGVAVGEFLFKVSTGLNEIEGMVYVQGSTFTMGCTSEQGSDCWDDEKPVHQVTLDGFYIGKYEVTQAEWEKVMGTNPSYFKGKNLPVEQVSWNDIQEFLRRLNAQTGGNYRLPTEAEWEYAAKGGNQSQEYKYSGSNNVGEVAWYTSNSSGSTHPVGQKRSNELGIYDMNGNVWEWCSDWYGGYSSNSQVNPKGPSSGSYRVIRGGSWNSGEWGVRVSSRLTDSVGYRSNKLGCRLACSSK
jgi:formylglycine-generating enzyme required for sulfatase activity